MVESMLISGWSGLDICHLPLFYVKLILKNEKSMKIMWKVMLHATFWFLLVIPIVEVGQQKEWKVSTYLLLES